MLLLEVKVPTATVAKLDVTVLHQCGDDANRQAHMASGTNLVANHRHAFFVSRAEPIIKAQNGIRDDGAKPCDLFFASLFVAEFD